MQWSSRLSPERLSCRKPVSSHPAVHKTYGESESALLCLVWSSEHMFVRSMSCAYCNLVNRHAKNLPPCALINTCRPHVLRLNPVTTNLTTPSALTRSTTLVRLRFVAIGYDGNVCMSARGNTIAPLDRTSHVTSTAS